MSDPAKAVDWLDREAAQWVWEHIPPHLAEIDRLAMEAVGHLQALPALPAGALLEWVNRLTALLYEIRNEAVTAGTMYRCAGEWSEWRVNDEIPDAGDEMPE